jgi:antirestriction protein
MERTSNSEDVLDSRDLIARVEEVEPELQDAYTGQGGNEERLSFEEWLEEVEADNSHTLQDAATEFRAITAFLEQMKGYGGDEEWRGDWYPVTLVRDSYFKEYAQELAEDVGAIPDDAAWPCTCIDWERAARELRMDYTAAEYDGVTYWFR